MKWKTQEYLLGDVCSRLSSGKGIPASNIKEVGTYPVHGANGLRGYTDNFNFEGDCAIIGRQGAYCGNVSYFSGKGYMTEHAVVVCANENHCTRYLAYILPSLQLGKLSSQAAQPGLAVSVLAKQKIELPSLSVQCRIVEILSAYDDLIENDQKQIKLLEEAARRLYKEWFVDLRFPGYENTPIVDGVPKNWTPCKLEDMIEFDPKISLTKERIKQFVPMSALSTFSMVLNTAEYTQTASNSGSKFQNGDTLLARITPCLENGKTAFVSGIESDEGAVGSTEYIVMRSKRLNPYMVYLLARTDNFRQSAINSMSGSDGRQRVKSDKLKSIVYLKPDIDTISTFATLTEPIFTEIFTLNDQSEKAAQARDRLLPKLMCGEIDV